MSLSIDRLIVVPSRGSACVGLWPRPGALTVV